MSDFRTQARQPGRSRQVANRWNAWKSRVRAMSNKFTWTALAGTPKIDRSRVAYNATESIAAHTGSSYSVGVGATGKYYMEFLVEHSTAELTAAVLGFGFKNTAYSSASHEGLVGLFWHNSGEWRVNTNLTGYTVQLLLETGDEVFRSPKANVILRVAIDLDNHLFYAAVDELWLTIGGPTGGDPADGNGMPFNNFAGVNARPTLFVTGSVTGNFSGIGITPPKERIPAGYTAIT